MLIFRPHCGGLQEAMERKQEFETELAMKEFLVSDSSTMFGVPLFSIEDVVISEPLGDDERVGWKDIRHVCVKRYGKEDYIEKYGCAQCVGTCSDNY